MSPTSARLDALETHLDTTVWRYGRDELVDTAQIEALLAEVDALVPLLDLEQKRRLHHRMQALHEAAADARVRLAERLGKLGAGRRAIQGYASLSRPVPTGRLRRRA